MPSVTVMYTGEERNLESAKTEEERCSDLLFDHSGHEIGFFQPRAKNQAIRERISTLIPVQKGSVNPQLFLNKAPEACPS